MRLTLTSFALLSLTTACIDLSGSSSNVAGEGPETDECKIEGSQIGRENLTMRLGSTTVTFTDWVAKPGEPNEFMGFTITVTGADSVSYVVKAGGEQYASRSVTWSHPQGLNANAISNVDFCDGDDGGDGGDGGDGSDGGDGGDGGDGCIEGCDDGGDGGDGGGDGGDGGGDGGDGGDGCIEGCDDGSNFDGKDTGLDDGGGGICFEPGGCDGTGGDTPPVTDGGGSEGGGDGTIL